MIKIRKIIFIFILGFGSLLCSAQSQNDWMLKMIPTTPEAYSITKYGNYPVSNYTGIPDISIPLYNIEVGKFNMPIQINYHGGGNKVNDLVSSVGLGWSLRAGGVISRTVMGVPDEVSPQGSFFSEIKHEDESTPEYLEDVANRDKDSEPDVFNYSFLGYSGKFVFGKNKEVVAVPYTDLKINFENNIFTLTDNLGRTYVFEERARNSSFSEFTSAKYFAPTSWYLTKIILENKVDIITISYNQYNLGNIPTIDYTLSLGWMPYGPLVSIGGKAGVNYQRTDASIPKKTVFFENPDEHYPVEISFPNGKVKFVYKDDRLDYGRVMLDSAIISDSNQGIIKKIAFDHDYFFSDAGYNAYAYPFDKYRLKLNKVKYIDKPNGTIFSEYKFEYEEEFKLPPRNNCGIDWWGYSNGKIYNEHLISLDEKGKEYEYNDGAHLKLTTSIYRPANREPDDNNMKAGILKRIYYPTGGYTDFDFEPNKVNVSYPGDPQEISYMAVGDKELGRPDEVEFTPTITTQNATLRINLPLWQDTKKPYAEFRNLTTGTNLRFVAFPGDPRYFTVTVPLTAGEHYKLIANISPNPSDPRDDTDERVLLTIAYTGDATEMVIKEQKGPGLRIKSIKNYTSANILASHEEYKYGKNESGVGQSRFFDYLLRKRTYVQNYLYTVYSIVVETGPIISFDASTLEVLSRPIYEYSSGSYLVAYPEVTKYMYSANGDNGKSVYTYHFEIDDLLEVNVPDPQSLSSVAWKTGNLLSEQHFRREPNGAYTLLTENINKYDLVNIKSDFGLKVLRKKIKNGEMIANPKRDQYNYFEYPIVSGINKLESTEFKSYNPGIVMSKNEKMLYLGDKNIQPRIVKTSKSDGSEEVNFTSYAEDYPAGTPFIDDMQLNHLTNYPIEQVKYKETNGITTVLSGGLIKYLNGGKGLVDQVFEIKTQRPISLASFKFSNQLTGQSPSTARTGFQPDGTYHPVLSYGGNYSNNGRPLTVVPEKGSPVSYLWGYEGQKLIAVTKNALQTDIAFTSFESGDKGNWNYSGSIASDVSAPTGNKVYLLTGGQVMEKNGLNVNKEYVLNYRVKNADKPTVLLDGNPAPAPTVVDVINGWTNYTLQFKGAANLQIVGNAIIDEVRLHPADALMTTYSYEPLVGITSETDAKGMTTYYEYDAFKRLKNIKDQHGNILKQTDYHYKN